MLQAGEGEKITNIIIDGMKWREQYIFKRAVLVTVVGIAGLVVGLAWAFSPLVGR